VLGVNDRALRISIVTPNFNMAAYLPDTIRSVLPNLGPQDEYFITEASSLSAKPCTFLCAIHWPPGSGA
jgi:hypothetical protein